MNAIDTFLKDNVRLPSPPAIAVRILDVVKREDYSFSQLAGIIQSDPALTGRLLRLANSAVYSVPRMVRSIDMAIAVVGATALKNMALSFIISQEFQGNKGERFDFDRLWRRSITAAAAAQLISAEVGFKSDETFITSLLQDIGVAAMFICRRDDYLAVLDEKAIGGEPIYLVEKKIFGFDHQDVGAELLKSWGLPESIYEPIRYHHQTQAVPSQLQKLTDVLRASDRMSAVYHGSGSVKNVRSVKGILSRTFGLKEDRTSALIDAVAEKSVELLAQFDVEPEKIKPYSQILQEANEELSRLNLSYETLVMEYNEEKQKAERLARELRGINDRLRDFAFRDGLTGLFNHRYFQETLARELARAIRYRHPLSLIMFDIDRFKQVNDVNGHQSGDFVLKFIGQTIMSRTRMSDLPARYGGDEFAIILPDTDLAGAKVKAEACRSAIEASEIQTYRNPLRVTVSVGIATYNPGSALDKDMFVDIADRAMYTSKTMGRNCVTVGN